MAVSSIRPPSRLASSSSKLHAKKKKAAGRERALSLQNSYHKSVEVTGVQVCPPFTVLSRNLAPLPWPPIAHPSVLETKSSCATFLKLLPGAIFVQLCPPSVVT